MFNLLATRHRPAALGHHQPLRYERLHEDLAQVLERLQPIEREVQTESGRWYLMRHAARIAPPTIASTASC